MSNPLHIAIIGTGLIGGSLGLAIRAARPDAKVIGYDKSPDVERARQLGAISAAATSISDAVEDADIVVVATPLSAMPTIFREMSDHLKPGTVVSDVGSVKQAVESLATELLPANVHFIGGHPMAGSERGGIEHADRFLLENATYVLCPPRGLVAHPMHYDVLVSLLESVGSRIILMDSARHDRIAAAVSHVPQLLAVALTNAVAKRNDSDETTLRLAAGGFRDMTRIASSPFELWKDILQTNQSQILDGLAAVASEIQSMRNRLIDDDLQDLARAFDTAQSTRDSIPKNTKGFLRPLSDIYVNANDQPGALLAIVQHLFDAGLSIKDIELLKMREGTGGTFRLGFETKEESSTAIDVLVADGHEARQL